MKCNELGRARFAFVNMQKANAAGGWDEPWPESERGPLEFMTRTLRVPAGGFDGKCENAASLQAKLKNCNYCRPADGGSKRGEGRQT